ncbi:hypothetical protein [Actinoplanes couchii]|uniref:Uncharacterized protein n=1 Tax=Actinoplanes couchii TaxID=403638 RepID=A0ABQ3XKB9_9ACTN|nr:hypothetical protein [Actinoplanes couchii]MDR6320541.1 hypothetical protein [Actinoplanes couchii]GID58945.1 hypothetical protein Aco03nite_073490 [Actinoplanes couchii]
MSHPPLLDVPPYYSATPPANRKSRFLIPAAIALALGAVVVAAVVIRLQTGGPKETTVSVVEPAALGGRPAVTGAQFDAWSAEMKKEIADDDEITDSFVRVYGTAGAGDDVLVLAFARPTDERDQERTALGQIMMLNDAEITVLGVDDVGPGPLGGAAKCGLVEFEDSEHPACSWADEGSVGLLIWLGSRKDPAVAEFVDLRAEIETKKTA